MTAIKPGSSAAEEKTPAANSPVAVVVAVPVNSQPTQKVCFKFSRTSSDTMRGATDTMRGATLDGIRSQTPCTVHGSCGIFQKNFKLFDQCVILSRLSLFRYLARSIWFLSLLGIIYGAVFKFEAYNIVPFLDNGVSITTDDPSYLGSPLNLLVTMVVVPLGCIVVLESLLLHLVKKNNIDQLNKLMSRCTVALAALCDVSIVVVMAYFLSNRDMFFADPLKMQALRWAVAILLSVLFFLMFQLRHCNNLSAIIVKLHKVRGISSAVPYSRSLQLTGNAVNSLVYAVAAVGTFVVLQTSELQLGAPLQGCPPDVECPRLRVPALAYYLTSVSFLLSLVFAFFPFVGFCLGPLPRRANIACHVIRICLSCLASVSVSLSYTLCCSVHNMDISINTWICFGLFVALSFISAMCEAFYFFDRKSASKKTNIVSRSDAGVSEDRAHLTSAEQSAEDEDVVTVVVHNAAKSTSGNDSPTTDSPKVVPTATAATSPPKSEELLPICICPGIKWDFVLFKRAFPETAKTCVYIDDVASNIFFFSLLITSTITAVYYMVMIPSWNVNSIADFIMVLIGAFIAIQAFYMLYFRTGPQMVVAFPRGQMILSAAEVLVSIMIVLVLSYMFKEKDIMKSNLAALTFGLPIFLKSLMILFNEVTWRLQSSLRRARTASSN